MVRAQHKVLLAVSLSLAALAASNVAEAQTIDSFSPASGTKGTVVTVTGKNLAGTQQVRLYATSALVKSATETTIVFVVPDATPATYPITIVSGDVVVSKPGFVVPAALPSTIHFATSMRTANASASETASALVQKVLVSGAGQGIDALNRAGYDATEQARAAREVFGKTTAGTAILLRGVGHSASTVATALVNAFGATPQDTATACGGAGYSVEATANALKNAYALTPAQTASALRAAAWGSIMVAGALKLEYKQNAQGVALALKAARYSDKENYDALVYVFGLTRKQALDVLLSIGYDARALLGNV